MKNLLKVKCIGCGNEDISFFSSYSKNQLDIQTCVKCCSGLNQGDSSKSTYVEDRISRFNKLYES